LLDQWLAPSNRPAGAYALFDVVDVLETVSPSTEVENHLCELVAQSSVDLDFLADITRRLGWGRAEQAVRQRLPQTPRLSAAALARCSALRCWSRAAFGHQLEDFALAWGELGDWVVVAVAPNELREDGWVDRGAAFGDARRTEARNSSTSDTPSLRR